MLHLKLPWSSNNYKINYILEKKNWNKYILILQFYNQVIFENSFNVGIKILSALIKNVKQNDLKASYQVKFL